MDMRGVRIPAGGVFLAGDLALDPRVPGLVVFAHGSGSSRQSPRNMMVADVLRQRGLGTLLFDLLTPEEGMQEEAGAMRRFDIPFLARRLHAASEWARAQPEMGRRPVGYFGSSTGAAAALVAAALHPEGVRAVVSRGGRPDLAQASLERVQAPTLLLVGGRDDVVVGLNRQAFGRLRAPKELRIVPGATHLFEEEGALEEVARQAADWFVRHFGE